jgi:DNA polymerase IV (archaeal DinB-like DNA polymerase)
MDYFFAQLEEKRRPMASGKIIVVCVYSGRTADSGVVSTVNYAGRAVGIHSGMPIAYAKKRAPPADSVFIPVDHEFYAQVSGQIDAIIRKRFKKVVQASIDEWNIDDESPASDAGKATEDAMMLKKAIRDELGLACSIGVAPSLLGAKMASSKSKPDGLLVLDRAEEAKMIGGSAVEKVPGIGPKTAQALSEMGATKVGDIETLDPIALVDVFGRKTGAWLHDLGRGRYDSGLGTEKEQDEISRIGTLKEKTRDPYMLLSKLDELEKEATERLMEMKKSYRTLSLIFVTGDLKTHTKSESFRNPKNWDADIRKEKEALVKAFLAGNPDDVRRIGIRFGNFMDLGGQTTLF